MRTASLPRARPAGRSSSPGRGGPAPPPPLAGTPGRRTTADPAGPGTCPPHPHYHHCHRYHNSDHHDEEHHDHERDHCGHRHNYYENRDHHCCHYDHHVNVINIRGK
jgi:hypothetical protein